MLGEPGFSLPERTTVVNLHSSTSESLEVNEIHAFKLVYETKMNVGTRKSRKTGSLQPLLRRNFKKNCAAEAVFEHGSMTPVCRRFGFSVANRSRYCRCNYFADAISSVQLRDRYLQDAADRPRGLRRMRLFHLSRSHAARFRGFGFSIWF